ncbi:MAG: tetratricopeptide repeat protein [bacterium]
MFNFFKKGSIETETEKKLSLFREAFKNKNYEEAKSSIEEIINIDPKISTSWFNYGVCLACLKMYNAAAEAYFRSYILETDQVAATKPLFRCCFYFAKSENERRLYDVISERLKQTPWMLDSFLETEELQSYFQKPDFITLVENIKNGNPQEQ